MHLSYPVSDGVVGILCRHAVGQPKRLSVHPYSNYRPIIDCSECLVVLEQLLEQGKALIRPGSKLVMFHTECGYLFNVDVFVKTCLDDEDMEFDRDVIAEISENTGESKEEVTRKLRAAGLTLVPPRDPEKPEYKFHSGGTFGFAGLR